MSLRAVRTEPRMATTNQKIWHAWVLSMGLKNHEKPSWLFMTFQAEQPLGDADTKSPSDEPTKGFVYNYLIHHPGRWKMMGIPETETTASTYLKPPTLMVSSFPLVCSSLYQFSFISSVNPNKRWYIMNPQNPNPNHPRPLGTNDFYV